MNEKENINEAVVVQDDNLTSSENGSAEATTLSKPSSATDEILPQPNSELEMLTKAIWQEERYIVEYALEIGFLKLSPQTRARLNIRWVMMMIDGDGHDAYDDEIDDDT